MKNPFSRNDHTTAWIATVAIGAIAAAAIAYFYFTRSDEDSMEEHHPEPPYHKPKGEKKRRKTDPHELEPIEPDSHHEHK